MSVVALCMGCGGGQFGAYGPGREIHFASTWGADELPVVEAAAQEWHVGWTSVVVDSCDGVHICVIPSDAPMPASPPFSVGSTYQDTLVSEIYRARIYALGRPDWLRVVVMHELGHQLSGSAMHLPAGNVMAASVNTQPAALTASDFAYAGVKP